MCARPAAYVRDVMHETSDSSSLLPLSQAVK